MMGVIEVCGNLTYIEHPWPKSLSFWSLVVFNNHDEYRLKEECRKLIFVSFQLQGGYRSIQVKQKKIQYIGIHI